MIYTSYFSKIKSLPSDCVPISICGRPIPGWTGLEYKRLAPKWSFFRDYKEGKIGQDGYVSEYNRLVLSGLDPITVRAELEAIVGPGNNPVLVCYEKPGDFCHRHLVAEWLGPDVTEYNYG